MSIVSQDRIIWDELSWKEAMALARRLVDGVGQPLDEGIVETVVALNLLGFRSSASCEGHLDGGVPAPWVDFVFEEACPGYEQAHAEFNRLDLSPEEQEAAWQRLKALLDALHHEQHLYTRLTALLDVFYAQQPEPSPQEAQEAAGCRLAVHMFEPGWYRLHPVASLRWDEKPAAVRARLLSRARAEMAAFTAFLKAHYFAQAEREEAQAPGTGAHL